MTNLSTNRKIIFFTSIFLLYLIFAKGTIGMVKGGRNETISLLLSSLIFTTSIFGVFYLTKLESECYSNCSSCNSTVSYSGGYGNAQNKHICGEMCGCGKPSKGLNLSLGKLCRGGPYMWQGDAALAKACRKLSESPERKAELGRYECGSTWKGMPGCGFQYTTISNDKWKNERCASIDTCDVSKNGIF